MPLWVSIENVGSGLFVALSSTRHGAQLHLEVILTMVAMVAMVVMAMMMMMVPEMTPRTKCPKKEEL